MSKRLSLRQFQQDLNDRLHAKGQAGERVSALGVQIGAEFWLVEMCDISEVLPTPPMTAVPLTKSWYRGVANVRGNLYSVADLAAFMGQGETPHDARDRVLLVAQKFAFNAGLLVNRVLGLRNTRTWRRSEADGRVQYEDTYGQVWRQLDIPRLLGKPEFLQVGS